jgi:drug/metabolite transporter (DMT)-like permease
MTLASSSARKAPRTSIAGLAPLGASCLWGGMYVVSKASFGSIGPIPLGLARLLVGGATLGLALALSRRGQIPGAGAVSPTLPKVQWWRFPALGLCIAATIVTQFLGTDLASAHDGALLTTTTPVFIVPIAWILLRERPSWRVILGMLIALVGVALVVGIGGSSAQHVGSPLLGDSLLILSALAWALFTVLGAPLVRASSALTVATYSTFWSLLFFLPLFAWTILQSPLSALPPPSFATLGSILYLGIGATALAWFLWYKGVEHLPASVAAIFFFAQPLVGGILSLLFLHEALGLSFWLGGCVLAVGILLVSV